MSRRDMEWLVQGMLQRLPTDPAALAKHLTDIVMTLIEKNNAAIEKHLEGRGRDEEQS